MDVDLRGGNSMEKHVKVSFLQGWRLYLSHNKHGASVGSCEKQSNKAATNDSYASNPELDD